MTPFTDITIERSGNVATIVIQRPPHNFFDMSLIKQIADAFAASAPMDYPPPPPPL